MMQHSQDTQKKKYRNPSDLKGGLEMGAWFVPKQWLTMALEFVLRNPAMNNSPALSSTRSCKAAQKEEATRSKNIHEQLGQECRI